MIRGEIIKKMIRGLNGLKKIEKKKAIKRI